MKKELIFHNKILRVECPEKAEKIATMLGHPIIIEMQIYFSCMLGKRLAYYSDTPIIGMYQLEKDQFKKILSDSKQLTKNIYIRFNTVMTISCPVSDYIGPPPVTNLPIVHPEVYVPSWLSIDFKNKVFISEYGWLVSSKKLSNTLQIRSAAI